jgi:hypothetical protein
LVAWKAASTAVLLALQMVGWKVARSADSSAVQKGFQLAALTAKRMVVQTV